MMTTNTPMRFGFLLTGILVGGLGYGALDWARGGSDAGQQGGDAMPSESMEMGGMDMPGMDMPGMETGGTMDMPEGEAVRITPAQIQQFGITFGSVEERPLESSVRTVGVIEVDETRVVEVTTKFPGYVDHLYADFTGKAVQAGEPLLDVYAPDLVAAQEEVLLARTLQTTVGDVQVPGGFSGSLDLEATARRRLSLWDIGDDQIAALVADGRPSRTLSLASPISGIVLEKGVVSGSAFQAGQTLFRLADLSEVWMDIEVRETDAPRVQRGSRAQVSLTAYPGEGYAGVVDFVYPMADERTRAIRARVVIRNPDGRVRPGMYGTVRLETPQRTALSVPLSAVVWTGEETLLFVEDEPGRIRPVQAEVGETVGEYVVVRSGVSAGQRVVVSAQYLIDAEANIGAVMRSMMSMMGAGDMGGMDMGGMDMEGMDMGGMDMNGGAMAPDSAAADPTGREE